jgi:hypothetical protein
VRRTTILAVVVSPCLLLALGGCFGKHPSAWRAAGPDDLERLRDHYKVETEGREVLRRDVSVWFIGPASGYPEWGVKREDGSVEIVAPETSRR